jgi:hypothetical protein
MLTLARSGRGEKFEKGLSSNRIKHIPTNFLNPTGTVLMTNYW